MPAATRVCSHIGCTAKTCNSALGRCAAVAIGVNLQGGADEQIAGIMPGRLTKRAVAAHAAIVAGKEHIRPCCNVFLHAQLTAEAVHALNKTGFNRGY